MIKIVIDAMGGDFAPAQQVKGAVEALAKDKELSVVLTGDESAVKAELSKYPYDPSRVEIVHAPEVITNDEVPTKAVKTKKIRPRSSRFSSSRRAKPTLWCLRARRARCLPRRCLFSGESRGFRAPRSVRVSPICAVRVHCCATAGQISNASL